VPKMSLRKSIVLIAAAFVFGSALTALWFKWRGSMPRAQFGADDLSGGAESKGCAEFRDAASRLGQDGCVSGRVLRVYTSRAGNTFLDFCEDYRHCPFTSVVFAGDREKFGDLNALTGRLVSLQGKIVPYQGRAEIILRDPQQIRLIP